MNDSLTLVLDVGKTHAKLSLWDREGGQLDQWFRANEKPVRADYLALDVEGTDRWLLETLATCSVRARIRTIVPVGHGAAAAIVHAGRLLYPPMDYEEPIPDDDRHAYALQRDAFEKTGSPFLPLGLNLGTQLHRIECLYGKLPEDATILPWPQYWAWRLTGVMAAEVSSLGCHSDLWLPGMSEFSSLAVARGWAKRMAPLKHAGDVLGTITADIAVATGLPPDCQVLCGLHDSNAALLGSRGHRQIADHEATVLSTGTWFVAMRTPDADIAFDTMTLPEARDCLINVDVDSVPVPSARFMGGREHEIITGGSVTTAASGARPGPEFDRVAAVVDRNACAIPCFTPGTGPFPDRSGHLVNEGDDERDRRIIASLYLAMMSATSLQLIGSKDRLLIEGRFADDEIFVRVLAALQPGIAIMTCSGKHDLAYGALRLSNPGLGPPTSLNSVQPLEMDLAAYCEYWNMRTRQ